MEKRWLLRPAIGHRSVGEAAQYIPDGGLDLVRREIPSGWRLVPIEGAAQWTFSRLVATDIQMPVMRYFGALGASLLKMETVSPFAELSAIGPDNEDPVASRICDIINPETYYGSTCVSDVKERLDLGMPSGSFDSLRDSRLSLFQAFDDICFLSTQFVNKDHIAILRDSYYDHNALLDSFCGRFALASEARALVALYSGLHIAHEFCEGISSEWRGGSYWGWLQERAQRVGYKNLGGFRDILLERVNNRAVRLYDNRDIPVIEYTTALVSIVMHALLGMSYSALFYYAPNPISAVARIDRADAMGSLVDKAAEEAALIRGIMRSQELNATDEDSAKELAADVVFGGEAALSDMAGLPIREYTKKILDFQDSAASTLSAFSPHEDFFNFLMGDKYLGRKIRATLIGAEPARFLIAPDSIFDEMDGALEDSKLCGR